MRKTERPKPEAAAPSQEHPKRPGYFHVDAVARLLNLTPRRVQQLAAEGSLPAAIEGGYYPLLETAHAYIKLLQERSRGRPITSQGVEDIALKAERKRKLQIENNLREGRLIEVDHVQSVFMESVAMLANVLDGAAGRTAGGDAVLRQRLLNEHRRIRAAFADRLKVAADRSDGGEPDDAATAENPGAMG